MIEDLKNQDLEDPRPNGPYYIYAFDDKDAAEFNFTPDGWQLLRDETQAYSFNCLAEAKRIFDSFDQSLFDSFRPFPVIKVTLWQYPSKEQDLEQRIQQVEPNLLQERIFIQKRNGHK